MPTTAAQASIAIFHLSFHVSDLTASRAFYTQLLGCIEGRSADTWVDFNFFGHQLSLHLSTSEDSLQTTTPTGKVDGVTVPMPHFGAVLTHDQWQQVADRLIAAQTPFVLEPQIRYAGETGEQRTLFVLDPSGNAIELKSMSQPNDLFQQ